MENQYFIRKEYNALPTELRFQRIALKVVCFSAKSMKHHEKVQVEDM